MEKKNKQKAIVLEKELNIQIEVLCEVMKTTFATKTKELLLEWKINELKRLKDDAPEMYQEYLDKTKELLPENGQ